MAIPTPVLFTNLVSQDKLNARYVVLATAPGYAPARKLLEEVFSKLPNPDGNFVKDFQTTGYDQRIWELYLFAAFVSINVEVSRPCDRPDFLIRTGSAVPIWVEATTANPTQGGQIIESDSLEAKNEQVAIKLGSPLFSKLSTDPKYWTLPHVAGNPLVFALADFHDPLPWRNPDNVLMKYLFGMTHRVISAPGERVELEFIPITEHSYAGKTIPSNFFGQLQVLLDSYKEAHQSVLISLGEQTRVAGMVTRVHTDCVEISSKEEDVALTNIRIVPFGAIRFIGPYKSD